MLPVSCNETVTIKAWLHYVIIDENRSQTK